MFLLVRRLVKLGISMINESLCLSESISSIYVSLAFVPSYCFAKFNSVVLHGSLVSYIVSLECHLCNLKPPYSNKLMESDFNFLTSFIYQIIYIHIISYFLNKLSKLLPTVVKMNIQSSL